MKASYTVSEQTQRAGASLLSGSAQRRHGQRRREQGVQGALRAAVPIRATSRCSATARPSSYCTTGGARSTRGGASGPGCRPPRSPLKPDFLPVDRPQRRARGRRAVDGAAHRGPEAVPARTRGPARRRGGFRGDGQRGRRQSTSSAPARWRRWKAPALTAEALVPAGDPERARWARVRRPTRSSTRGCPTARGWQRAACQRHRPPLWWPGRHHRAADRERLDAFGRGRSGGGRARRRAHLCWSPAEPAPARRPSWASSSRCCRRRAASSP